MLYLLWKAYTVIQYHVLRKLSIIQSYYLSYSSTELSPPLWKLVTKPSSLEKKIFREFLLGLMLDAQVGMENIV